MSRMKSVLAVLLLTASLGLATQADAQVVKVMIAGSSAMWQSMALAAYNKRACTSGGTAPCFHYTSGSNFNLNDTRPAIKGGTTQADKGGVWIVWDSAASPNVWAYIKVDSAVGDRCYFGQPRCNVNVSAFPAVGNAISSTLWGDGTSDTLPPAAVQALFTGATGPSVNTAATDIRPEDALFATCRANSALGGGVDLLAGLGYNSHNTSGKCPTTSDLAHLQGADILSGYPASTATAHIIAFNISGTDPFSGLAIPVATTVPVGAAPIIFITARTGALAGVKNASDSQLEQVFSGKQCTGSVFLGGGASNIQVFLREPLSGTMNTTEATVFRFPNITGASQETKVNAANPLTNSPCTTGGTRWRSIGTGEEVKFVQNSHAIGAGVDGIGYTFFSYGNVSSIANNPNYGYLQLDGIDGIFHKYGSTIDPGQPAGVGVLPAAANLPAACGGAFPCPESKIWSGNLSFPNLRNGSYRAWSILRIVSDGTALANARLLATGAQTFVVTTVPDYVPAQRVGIADPGLALLRSHYTQAGVAPVNISGLGDKGGDMGGCILSSTGVTATTDTTTKLAQGNFGSSCAVVP